MNTNRIDRYFDEPEPEPTPPPPTGDVTPRVPLPDLLQRLIEMDVLSYSEARDRLFFVGEYAWVREEIMRRRYAPE